VFHRAQHRHLDFMLARIVIRLCYQLRCYRWCGSAELNILYVVRERGGSGTSAVLVTVAPSSEYPSGVANRNPSTTCHSMAGSLLTLRAKGTTRMEPLDGICSC
jgi:hypothetical protein